MKKLLYILFLVMLTSCDRTEYVEPTYEVITNKGLPILRSDQYFESTIRVVVKLAQGYKITTTVETFSLAEYKDGGLELKFHPQCTDLNANMRADRVLMCDTYEFINPKIKECNQ